MSGACSPCYWPEPVQSVTMSVHQMIQELSPFVKFTHFTANQAILDGTTGNMDVHVIDFNLGEGIQWPSLMSALARQGGKSFHLTAIITDPDYINNTHHTAARCLAEFAEPLNLPFQYTIRRTWRTFPGTLKAQWLFHVTQRICVTSCGPSYICYYLDVSRSCSLH